jgi:anti-anti-sigma regulatory factor
MSVQPEHSGSGDTLHRAVTTRREQRSCCLVFLSCMTESLPYAAGEIMVLRVAGEVDLCTSQAALGKGLDQHSTHLFVDLARMTFCSARGLDLLVHTGHITAETATRFAVCGVAPQIDRVWTLVWDGDLPIRHRSIAAAMTVIGLPSKTEHCGLSDMLTSQSIRGQPHHEKPLPRPPAELQIAASPTSTATLVTPEHRRFADALQGRVGWG